MTARIIDHTSRHTLRQGTAAAPLAPASMDRRETATEPVVEPGAGIVEAGDLDDLTSLGVLVLDRLERGDGEGFPDVRRGEDDDGSELPARVFSSRVSPQ